MHILTIGRKLNDEWGVFQKMIFVAFSEVLFLWSMFGFLWGLIFDHFFHSFYWLLMKYTCLVTEHVCFHNWFNRAKVLPHILHFSKRFNPSFVTWIEARKAGKETAHQRKRANSNAPLVDGHDLAGTPLYPLLLNRPYVHQHVAMHLFHSISCLMLKTVYILLDAENCLHCLKPP